MHKLWLWMTGAGAIEVIAVWGYFSQSTGAMVVRLKHLLGPKANPKYQARLEYNPETSISDLSYGCKWIQAQYCQYSKEMLDTSPSGGHDTTSKSSKPSDCWKEILRDTSMLAYNVAASQVARPTRRFCLQNQRCSTYFDWSQREN